MGKRIVALTLLYLSLSGNTLAAGDKKHHHLNHHIVGVFNGITDTEDTSETGYGLEYEYRYNHRWGLGVVWEKTQDGYDDHHGHRENLSVTLASAYYHINAWRLGLGAGQERVHGDHPHTESLIRASVAYDIHLTEKFGVAPIVNLDRVDNHNVYVYGMTFNIGF